MLDFPLMEFLDCVWLDDEFHGERDGNSRAQAAKHADGYSQKLYGAGGLLPGFVSHQRGIGAGATPMIHYRGADVRAALAASPTRRAILTRASRCASSIPANGAPVFPTLAYARAAAAAGRGDPRSSARPRARCTP